jgi:ribosome-binding factor A
MKKRGFDRTQRVADLIQQALATILLQECDDDRYKLLTITSVTVSRDLSYAKVYVSMLLDEPEQIKEVIHLLNDSVKPLRYQLARAVDLRIVPELKFVYDESSAHGFRLSHLINSAIKKTENK